MLKKLILIENLDNFNNDQTLGCAKFVGNVKASFWGKRVVGLIQKID